MYVANTFVHQIHVNNPWRYLQYLKCTMRTLRTLNLCFRIVEYPLYIEPVTQTLSSPGLQDQSIDFYQPSFPGLTENYKVKNNFFFSVLRLKDFSAKKRVTMATMSSTVAIVSTTTKSW